MEHRSSESGTPTLFTRRQNFCFLDKAGGIHQVTKVLIEKPVVSCNIYNPLPLRQHAEGTVDKNTVHQGNFWNKTGTSPNFHPVSAELCPSHRKRDRDRECENEDDDSAKKGVRDAEFTAAAAIMQTRTKRFRAAFDGTVAFAEDLQGALNLLQPVQAWLMPKPTDNVSEMPTDNSRLQNQTALSNRADTLQTTVATSPGHVGRTGAYMPPLISQQYQATYLPKNGIPPIHGAYTTA
mmetsp:Transcript_90080/g.179859  ORF Transcript_90080/g.179859 Transcript_90080/m.179859 type:complete len:237 (-) Transcript_90080:46-756(-)